MKKKKDYKIIQVSFRNKKQYDEFHHDAVRYHGTDNRLADSAYIRECIKSHKKSGSVAIKEKAKALVEEQMLLTKTILETDDKELESRMIRMSEEMIRLWVH